MEENNKGVGKNIKSKRKRHKLFESNYLCEIPVNLRYFKCMRSRAPFILDPNFKL